MMRLVEQVERVGERRQAWNCDLYLFPEHTNRLHFWNCEITQLKSEIVTYIYALVKGGSFGVDVVLKGSDMVEMWCYEGITDVVLQCYNASLDGGAGGFRGQMAKQPGSASK